MTLTREEMVNWLEQWLKISQNIDSKLISIFEIYFYFTNAN